MTTCKSCKLPDSRPNTPNEVDELDLIGQDIFRQVGVDSDDEAIWAEAKASILTWRDKQQALYHAAGLRKLLPKMPNESLPIGTHRSDDFRAGFINGKNGYVNRIKAAIAREEGKR